MEAEALAVAGLDINSGRAVFTPALDLSHPTHDGKTSQVKVERVGEKHAMYEEKKGAEEEEQMKT